VARRGSGGLHLDEHERVAIERNQVDLADRLGRVDASVASDDREPLRRQAVCNEPLRGAAEALAGERHRANVSVLGARVARGSIRSRNVRAASLGYAGFRMIMRFLHGWKPLKTA
jgi:hypothetical protein